jgi:energy-coupling factor transport system permease protein
MIIDLLTMVESLIDYEPIDSFLHRLHPLTKMATVVFVIVGGMYMSQARFHWGLNAGIFAFLVLLAVAGRIPLVSELRQRGAYVGAILAVLFVTNLIFARGGAEAADTHPEVTVYFQIPPFIYATSLGLNFAINKTFLMLSSIVVVIVVLRSTRLADLTYALTRIGVPYSVATITATAFRCVPMVVGGLITVYNAHRSRGMELEKGGFRDKIRQWRILITPLMMVLLRWVDQMTLVFESRGLDFSARERTRLNVPRFRLVDGAFVVVLTLGLALFIVGQETGYINVSIY